MLKSLCAWMFFELAATLAWAAPVEVSALHPLMADLARQVGGNHVEVHDLTGGGGNLHRFEPRPADMKQMQSSVIVFAAGKNMEIYLERLKSNLGGVTVVEVGRTIPSLTIGKDAVYTCCPGHGVGVIDPHWWNGIDNMRRAARVVAQALSEKDPDAKAYYTGNAIAYGQRLDVLKKWAKLELAKVPSSRRKLVTSHNALAYFAKEFGFEVIAVAGLTKEQNVTPQEQAKTIESVKNAAVPALFPEKNTSGKSLDAIVKATGTRLGDPLIADGNGTGDDAGFEAIIRHNVNAITKGLVTP